MRNPILAGALLLASLPAVGHAAPLAQTPTTVGTPVSTAPTPQTTPATTPMAPSQAGTAAPFGGLIIQSDMVNGTEALRENCILQNRFSPGDRVVFRARVIDGQTGQPVRDGEVIVRMADGTMVPLRYSPHPPPFIGPATDEYWTAAWPIPTDAPLGIIRYTVEASAGGRTGRFEPFNLELSLLTIVPRS